MEELSYATYSSQRWSLWLRLFLDMMLVLTAVDYVNQIHQIPQETTFHPDTVDYEIMKPAELRRTFKRFYCGSIQLSGCINPLVMLSCADVSFAT